MINSYRKKLCGAATFLITAVLLVSVTLIAIFAANYSSMQQKTLANLHRASEAYEAAEAGLEFGIKYLEENDTAIIANQSGGYLLPYVNSNTSNVTLSNGSTYTIVYTNPTQNDFTVIQITSTGTNNEGTATRAISQLVSYGSTLFNPPTNPIAGKGNINIGGSSLITNLSNSTTVVSGGTVSMSGSSGTVNSGGTSSTPGNIQSDIQQNNSTMSSDTTESFFARYFGTSMNTVKNNADYTYANLSNYNSVLNGKAGVTIWIDQTSGNANLSGTTVIGTPTQPVLLIVNGNFSMSGNTTIYGLLVVLGEATTAITGNSNIVGGLIATNTLNLSGNNSITFSSTVMSAIQQNNHYYAKIAGSWRDYP